MRERFEAELMRNVMIEVDDEFDDYDDVEEQPRLPPTIIPRLIKHFICVKVKNNIKAS